MTLTFDDFIRGRIKVMSTIALYSRGLVPKDHQ